MGLFGHWSKKRDQQDKQRAEDFSALLDRLEEKIKEEEQEADRPEQPDKPAE